MSTQVTNLLKILKCVEVPDICDRMECRTIDCEECPFYDKESLAKTLNKIELELQ